MSSIGEGRLPKDASRAATGLRVLRRTCGISLAVLTAALLAAATAAPAAAQTAAPVAGDVTPANPDFQQIRIGYVEWKEKSLTLSLSQNPPDDLGVAGALSAIRDNNTTGTFTKQEFHLLVEPAKTVEEALAARQKLVDQGAVAILTDVPADALLALADADADKAGILFNVAAKDERLREEDCRINVVHIQPSHSMLADALAQYLVWKKWPRWFLLTGALPADKEWAEALKRAAGRFGGEIVEERFYSETDTARRTDSGHIQVQRQLPVFTQNAPDHDVVLVADESEIFGTYVPFRTWDPRPVAGSAGLIPTTWTPNHEQWAGFQMQNRFGVLNTRQMQSLDINAWTAVRMVGDAATKAQSAETAKIREAMLDERFGVAAFKGEKLTIRKWNHQLRQPILLADGFSVISVSPQEGFLHPNSLLDTLGYDEPETKCSF